MDKETFINSIQCLGNLTKPSPIVKVVGEDGYIWIRWKKKEPFQSYLGIYLWSVPIGTQYIYGIAFANPELINASSRGDVLAKNHLKKTIEKVQEDMWDFVLRKYKDCLDELEVANGPKERAA